MSEALTPDWGPLAHAIRQDHPGEGTPPWKDNGYLNFWDPARGVFGVVHVSTSPNAEGRRARASFSARGRVTEVVEVLPVGVWASDSISFELDGRVEVHAPDLDVSLKMLPRGKPADYNAGGLLPALDGREAPQHFQGAVTVTGTASVQGEHSNVTGVGLRDRTWGFRDDSAQFPEYYGLIVDVAGRMLTIMKFARPDGGSITDGFLLGDGEPVPAREVTNLRRDPAALFSAAVVTTTVGETLSFQLRKRLAGFWIPTGTEGQGPKMSGYDEMIEVVTPDGVVGHGFFEQGIVRRLS